MPAKASDIPIGVAVVEDSRDLRSAMTFILGSAPNCHCIGAFERAEDLIERLGSLTPDVILMDIGLPGMTGIEATRRIKENHPDAEIIILSVFEDDNNIFEAICAGASGYVTKPVMPQRLLDAIDETYAVGTPMSPHIARKVLTLFKNHVPPKRSDYQLTERELEVLESLVKGHDFKEIAEDLIVSVFTVRAHIRNIYEKLHVHSKSQAVAKALRERLI